MRPALCILPCLSFFIGMIGTTISSNFPELSIVSKISWSIALGLIALWLTLDFNNLKRFFSRSGTKFGAGSGLVLILGLLIAVGLGFLSNRPRFNKSFDLTRAGSNTLSNQSVKIIENMGKKSTPVDMTAFFQDEIVKDQFRSLIKMYEAEGMKFNVEYISTLEDPTRAVAEKLTSGNTVIFRLGEQESRISTFNEEKITNALVKLLKPTNKKVYFVTGHGEGKLRGEDPDGYGIIVQQLENDRYTVEELSLTEKVGVPDDADLVIIAGPKYDISQQEATLLESYLKTGGALMALIDAVRPIKNLNALMKKFGISFNSDLLILSENDPRAALFGRHFTLVTDFDSYSPVTKEFAKNNTIQLLIPFTRSLETIEKNEYSMKVSIAASSASFMERVSQVTEEKDLENISPDRISSGSFPVLAVANGQTPNPKLASGKTPSNTSNTNDSLHEHQPKENEVKSDTTSGEGMAPSKKEIRLVALGSSQFASNQGTQITASNRDLFLNISSYLLQDEDFISIRPKDITKSTLSLTSGMSQLTLSFISLIYPFFFLGFGVYYWLRRRNA
ncbi:MAG: Gldg family protein [Bdellovibrionota bacterium]